MEKKEVVTEISPRISPFCTPQVKGKLKKKVKESLTGTSDQNRSILNDLLNDSGPAPKGLVTNEIPIEVITKIVNFYNSDEVSRASPNTKDYTTAVIDERRIKLSIKYLMFSLKEVYAMFSNMNPDIKISFSKFFEVKPVQIKSFTKQPHNVCCCQIHENLRCGLKALKSSNHLFGEIRVDYGMHDNFVCDEPTDDCFSNSCISCKDSSRLKLLAETMENPSQIVSWWKWVKNDKKKSSTDNDEDCRSLYCNIEKVKKSGSVSELLEEIYEGMPQYLDHQFVKMSQSKCAEKLIEEAMAPDSDTAVVICDFAEKFKCFQQNATQSAHYGQTPVALFTVAVYHRQFIPKAIASDCEKQTKESVLAYLDVVCDQLPKTVKSVDVWSDNATSQFKNQYILEALKTFEIRHKIKIRWNFFAAMHGKSVVDGIGGSVKRFVRTKILAQDIVIRSAEDFVSIASSMEIQVLLLKLSDIKRRNISIGLSAIVKAAKKVTDIKKKHCFEVNMVKVGKKMIPKIVGYKISY